MKRQLRLRFFAAIFGGLFAGAATAAPTILVWGDSLSAGYGLDARSGWVYLLEQKLKSQAPAQYHDWVVINGSVSGETTAGGLSRLPAALDRYRPAIVLLELGANDGLRGQPVETMRENLQKMVRLSKASGAQPVIFEMRIPANYGPAYTEKFRQAFADAAKAGKLPMVPFFLAAVATDPRRWFQDDGIHPNAQAQPALLDAVWPTLQPLLSAPAASRDRGRP